DETLTNKNIMKIAHIFFLSLSVLLSGCKGQEASNPTCELDFLVDEMSRDLTLGNIVFEDPVMQKAVIESNASLGVNSDTPVKYIDQIILNREELKSTKDLQYFFNLKKLIINQAGISCINLSNNINLEQLQLP